MNYIFNIFFIDSLRLDKILNKIKFEKIIQLTYNKSNEIIFLFYVLHCL